MDNRQLIKGCKLTDKQEAFVLNYTAIGQKTHANAMESMKQAGYEATRQASYKLLHSKKIQEAITIINNKTSTSNKITLEAAKQHIWDIMHECRDIKDYSNALRANEDIIKTFGGFIDKTQINQTIEQSTDLTPEEIEAYRKIAARVTQDITKPTLVKDSKTGQNAYKAAEWTITLVGTLHRKDIVRGLKAQCRKLYNEY